jgi:hypothetical protein
VVPVKFSRSTVVSPFQHEGTGYFWFHVKTIFWNVTQQIKHTWAYLGFPYPSSFVS